MNEEQKILININKDYIQSKQAFSNKLFFGMLAFIVGLLAIFLTEPAASEKIEGIQTGALGGLFFVMLSLFMFLQSKQFGDNRRDYSKLADKLIDNDSS